MTLLAKRTTSKQQQQKRPSLPTSHGRRKHASVNKFLTSKYTWEPLAVLTMAEHSAKLTTNPFHSYFCMYNDSTETYHMIENCDDPSIVSWNGGGDCFTVKDVPRFETQCLPKYFNHSNFSSFTRQLNFYGFTKLRSDPDLQMSTNSSVRFCHEFFQRGKPELLQNIQRATAYNKESATLPPSRASSPCNSSLASVASAHQQQPAASAENVEALKQQVDVLRTELTNLTNNVEVKLSQVITTMEQDYKRRVQEMEALYSNVITAVLLRKSLAGAGGLLSPMASPSLPPSRLPRIRQSSE